MKPEELLENMDPLLPADFFSCSFALSSNRFTQVPDMSALLEEDPFASLQMKWSEEGIEGTLLVDKAFEGSFFPEYQKGDSLELFVDTRDHKKNAFISRFCHHFVFLAGEVNGVRAEEMTRFRSDDSHPLCSSKDLHVSCRMGKSSYELSFFLSESALHGFNPLEFKRLGFAYRVNRYKGKPQHFPIASERFELLDHPSLWASCQLT